MFRAIPGDVMVYIVTRFVPVEMVLFARASRSLWARYAAEGFMWARVAEVAFSDYGRAGMLIDGLGAFEGHSTEALARRYPGLDRHIPVRVSNEEALEYFAVSPDGKLVVSTSGDSLFVKDRSRAYTPTRQIQLNTEKDENWLTAVAFSPLGTLLACISHALNKVWVFESETLILKSILRGHLPWVSLCFLDEDTLVTAGFNGQILARHAFEKTKLFDLRDDDGVYFGIHRHGSLAASRTLFAAGTLLNPVLSRESHSFAAMAVRKSGKVDVYSHAGKRVFALHAGKPRCVCFSADGGRMVTGSVDGTARVWDTLTGQCVHVHRFDWMSVSAVCVSKNNLLAASVESVVVIAQLGGDVLKSFTVHDAAHVQFACALDSHTEQEIVFMHFAEADSPLISRIVYAPR